MAQPAQMQQGRTYRPGEFQSIPPENKLNVSQGHTNANNFSASIDKSGKINLVVSNTNQHSVSIGYVRKDGSFSDCQNDSLIRSNAGNNKLISINQQGTYSAQVTHNNDGTSTINVVPDQSLSAVKIKLGGQVYFLKISELNAKRVQDEKAAEEAKKAAADKVAKEAEVKESKAPATKESSDTKEGNKTTDTDKEKKTSIPPENDKTANQSSPTTPVQAQKLTSLVMPDKGFLESVDRETTRALITGGQAALATMTRSSKPAVNQPITQDKVEPYNGYRVNPSNALSQKEIELNKLRDTASKLQSDFKNDITAAQDAKTKFDKITNYQTQLKELNQKIDAQIKELSTEINPKSASIRELASKAKDWMKGVESTNPELKPIIDNIKELRKIQAGAILEQKKVLDGLLSSGDAVVKEQAQTELLRSKKEIVKAYDRMARVESDSFYRTQHLGDKATFLKEVKDFPRSIKQRLVGAFDVTVNAVSPKSSGALREGINSAADRLVTEPVSKYLSKVKKTETLIKEIDDAKTNKVTRPEGYDHKAQASYQRKLEKLEHRLAKEEGRLTNKVATAENLRPAERFHKVQEVRRDLLNSLNELIDDQKALPGISTEAKSALEKTQYVKYADKLESNLDSAELKKYQDGRAVFLAEEKFKTEKLPKVMTPAVGAALSAHEQAAKDFIDIKKSVYEAEARLDILERGNEELKVLDQGDEIERLKKDQLTKSNSLVKAVEDELNNNTTLTDVQKKELTAQLKEIKTENQKLTIDCNDEVLKAEKQARRDLRLSRYNELEARKFDSQLNNEKDPVLKRNLERSLVNTAKEAAENDLKSLDHELKACNEKIKVAQNIKTQLETDISSLNNTNDPTGDIKKAKESNLSEVKKRASELEIESKLLDAKKKLLDKNVDIKVKEKTLVDLKDQLDAAPDENARKTIKAGIDTATKDIQNQKIELAKELKVESSKNSLRMRSALKNVSEYFEYIEKSNSNSFKGVRETLQNPKVAFRAGSIAEGVERMFLADYNGEVSHSAIPRLIASLGRVADNLTSLDLEQMLGKHIQYIATTTDQGVKAKAMEFVSGAGDVATIGLGFKVVGHAGSRLYNTAAWGGTKLAPFVPSFARVSAPPMPLLRSAASIGVKFGGLGAGTFAHGYMNMRDASEWVDDTNLQYSVRTGTPVALGAGFGFAVGGPIGALVGVGAGTAGEIISSQRALADMEKEFSNDLENKSTQLSIKQTLDRSIIGFRKPGAITDRALSVEEQEVINRYAQLETDATIKEKTEYAAQKEALLEEFKTEFKNLYLSSIGKEYSVVQADENAYGPGWWWNLKNKIGLAGAVPSTNTGGVLVTDHLTSHMIPVVETILNTDKPDVLRIFIEAFADGQFSEVITNNELGRQDLINSLEISIQALASKEGKTGVERANRIKDLRTQFLAKIQSSEPETLQFILDGLSDNNL